MRASDQYNHDLYGLPIERPKTLNVKHLIFLRHLAVRGQLEHEAAGMASGPVVDLIRETERVGRAS